MILIIINKAYRAAFTIPLKKEDHLYYNKKRTNWLTHNVVVVAWCSYLANSSNFALLFCFFLCCKERKPHLLFSLNVPL